MNLYTFFILTLALGIGVISYFLFIVWLDKHLTRL
jgi:hypothetical protein